jgi:hypothetical protein
MQFAGVAPGLAIRSKGLKNKTLAKKDRRLLPAVACYPPQRGHHD